MTLEYRQSLTEVDTIIHYMNPEYLDKLPKKLINFININKDNNYAPNIVQDLPIDEQDLKNDTKALISLLYRNYWCDNETKNILNQQDLDLKNKQEEEIREKYNPNKIFKAQMKDTTTINNSVVMIEYKETFFRRLINKIKAIFKIK